MTKPSFLASLGNPLQVACSPAFTSPTSGWTTPRCSAPLRSRTRLTKPSFEAAGCRRGSMRSSMTNSEAPTVTATLFGGMDESLYADFKKGCLRSDEFGRKHAETHARSLRPRAHGLQRFDSLRSSRRMAKRHLGSSGIQIQFRDRSHHRRRPPPPGRSRPARQLASGQRAPRGIPQRFESGGTLPDPGLSSRSTDGEASRRFLNTSMIKIKNSYLDECPGS